MSDTTYARIADPNVAQPTTATAEPDYISNAFDQLGLPKYSSTQSKYAYASPTASDPAAISLSNNSAVRFLQFMSRSNPLATLAITREPYYAAIAPELSSVVRDDEVAGQVFEQLFSAAGSQREDGYLSEIQARGLREISQVVSPRTMDALQYAMAQLDEQGQDYLVAKTLDKLSTFDADGPMAEAELLMFIGQVGHSRQQFELSEDSFIGRLGVGVETLTGGKFLRHQAANVWASAATPQDAWYRKALTLGENMEISAGDIGIDLPIPHWGPLTAIDYALKGGTEGAAIRSGLIDGVANIALDPVAWMANFGAGAKIAKTIPIASSASKASLATKALIPIKGANALRLPLGTRSLTSRMGYLFNAKTVDQMLLTKNGTNLVKWLAKTDSAATIMERIPEWEAAAQLVKVIADETDEGKIRQLIRWGIEGGFGETNPMRVNLQNLADGADEALNTSLNPRLPVIVATEGADEMAEVHRVSALSSGRIIVRANPDIVEAAETVTTRTGRTIRIARRELEDGTRAYIALDESGEVIGARIGSVLEDGTQAFTAGTNLADEGTGVYGALLRASGATPEELRRSQSLTTQAAGAAERAFAEQQPKVPLQSVNGVSRYSDDLGVLEEVTPGSGKFRVVAGGFQGDDVERALLNPNAQILNGTDPRVQARIEKFIADNELYTEGDDVADVERYVRMYAEANGFDAIHYGDDVEVLNNSVVLRGIDASEPAIADDLIQQIVERQMAQRALDEFDRGTKTSAWLIKDMPTGKFRPDVDDAIKPRKFSGGSNSNSWWARTIKSRFFGQYPPSEITLTNQAEGALQLKRFLQYIGVKHEDVLRHVDRFYAAKFHERYGVIREIVQEAGESIDHPLIRHNLVEFFNRQGSRAFGIMPDGSEVLSTQSATLGRASARPFIPSMLTETVELPDPKSLVTQLRRYRWSQNIGPNLTAGLLKGTKDRRLAIANKLRAQLGKQAAGFTDEEMLAMAYASVGPGSAGNAAYGAVAKMRNTTTSAWRGLVSVFSIAQLAFRPIPWAGRVLLDENARAAFANLPTVMRNPVRWLSSTMDAYHLGKAVEYRTANLRWARETMAGLRAIDDPIERWNQFKAIVTNWDELVDSDTVELLITNPGKLNRIMSSILSDAAIKNDFGAIVGGVSTRRQRAYKRAIQVGQEFGMDITRRDFTWQDDVSEIANKGWATMYGMNHKVTPVEFVAGQMTQAGAEEYARVWLNNLQMLSADPMIRYALMQMEARYLGRSGLGAGAEILQSTGWKRIEPYVRQWADETGRSHLQGYSLLDEFVNEKLMAYTRNIFGDFLGEDAQDNARIIREILDTKTATIDGVQYSFNKGSEGLAALDARVASANQEVRALPKLYSVVSPHALMDEPSASYVDKIKNFPSRVIGFFGDEISQKAQRRGSYIDVFRREKELRMGLGMSERQATEMAKIVAAETVNNVYYNLESVTPFLKNMNQVIPFFTAAWEIAETWAYKVPMLQGPFPIGHAAMIRRIDRVTDALRELGLIQYDENGSPALVLDAEASTGNVFGDSLSRGAALMIRQPLMIAEHFMNMGHALTTADDEEWNREDGIVPDRFQFSVSSPIDIEHYGIGSALDISLSMQPVAQFALSQLREQIPAVASHKEIEVTGTLGMVADENDVDGRRVIAYNLDVLRESLGTETVNLLLTGAIDIDEVDVSGLTLRMPNTGVWSQFADRVFFPFGNLDEPGEVFTQFQPTWVKYVWRSLGLWQGGNAEDGFLGVNMNNVNKAAVAGQVISNLRHLQATEGVYENIDQYRTEFYDLAQPYLDARTAEIRDGELYWKGEKPADSSLVDAAWQTLRRYSDAVLQRAIENAASTTMMRGMLAAILPGTPRMFYEEERIVDGYYAAQNAQNDQTSLLHGTTIDETVDYIRTWAEDETGGRSMRLFLESHPELAPYLEGKSYWGAGGQPPLERSLELYFEDVENGLRDPVSPDVFLHRSAVSANETERQIAFIEAFGDDPYAAAAASLADPQKYQEVMAEFNTKREMLAWEDELNGNAYAEWKQRNRADNFSIIEEALTKYNDYSSTISDLIQIVEANPLMTIDEVELISGELKGLRAGLSNIRNELELTDEEYSWMQPHMRLRMQYFDDFYGPYIDEAGKIYDEIAASSTSEQQDYLWNKLAQLKDVVGLVPPVIDGREFPAVTQFQYENKDPEIRNREQVQQLTYKPEWLDEAAVTHILAERPQLEQYLPSTPFQRSIYDEFNSELERLDRAYANGTGTMTFKQYNDVKEALQGQLEKTLFDNGYGAQVEWRYYWPVQRLSIAGELPVEIPQEFVDYASAIQRHRRSQGYVSVGEDDPGRRALTSAIFVRAESDPAFLDALTELGITLYGESLIDEIVPLLFFNDRF